MEDALKVVEDRKKKRQQAEVQETLDNIQKRISLALNEYEYNRKPTIPPSEVSETDTITIEDPSSLYEVLTDVKKRQKYQKQSTVIIVEYEDRIDERTQILSQIEEFFNESQSSGAQKLLEEVGSDEVDLVDATAGIEEALEVAKRATDRLTALQSEMIRLLTINAQYPDTKKGRKKMEKALLKAQEEVQELTDNLVNTTADLKLTEQRRDELKMKLDAKNSEISKLKKESDKVKQLTTANNSLQRDMDNLKSVLQKTRGELEGLKKIKLAPKPPPTEDDAKVAELETRVSTLQKEIEDHVTAKQVLEDRLKEADVHHESEMKRLQESFEIEMSEMRDKFEDQIKSLVDVDDPFEDTGDDLDVADTVEDAEDPPPPPADSSRQSPCDNPPDIQNVEDSDPVELTNTEEPASAHEIPEDKEPEKENVLVLTSKTVSDRSPAPSPLNSDSGHSGKVSVNNSSTPTMNALTVRQMETYTKEQIEKLKSELAENDRKWKAEVAEVRNRSKKTITSVKAQLVEAQNKHIQEADTLKKDLAEKTNSIAELESKYQSLENKLKLSEEEKDRITDQFEQSVNHLTEAKQALTHLQKLVVDLETHPEEVAAEVRDLISRSIQWSTPPISRPPTTMPGAVGTGEHSATSLDLVPPKHGTSQHGTEPAKSVHSSRHNLTPSVVHDPQLSRHSPYSSQASLLNFTKSTTPHLSSSPVVVPMSPVQTITPPIAHGPVSLHDSSLRRSLVLSSPVGQEENDIWNNAQPIRRHQGHMSVTPAVVQLSANHPVVKEWVKAYNSVLLFKDHLADIITEHFSEDLVSALMDMDKLDFSLDSEVQGQITQMRCSLALLLHQIEHVLQEALSQAAMDHSHSKPEGTADDDSCVVRENSELKVVVKGLEDQLATKEKSHKLEMQRSQEAITQLESTVMSLQKEIASMRRKAKELGTNQEEIVMFTRLDSERNERNLNKALRQGTISTDDVAEVKQTMSEYVGLQADRFAHLTRGLQQRHLQRKLLSSLEESEQTELSQKVRDRAQELQKKQQVQWSLEMNTMSLKREKLARVLTIKLSEMETTTGMFLIKPIICNSPSTLASPIITPIRKPLPQRLSIVLPQRPSKPAIPSQPSVKIIRIARGSGSKSGDNPEHRQGHPKLKLIEKLLSQKKIRDQEKVQGDKLKLTKTPPLLKKTQKDTAVREWSVITSRMEEPSIITPSLPKLFELDSCVKQVFPLNVKCHGTKGKIPSPTLPPIKLPETAH